MAIKNLKLIFLGERGCGKSSLISSYLFGHPVLPKKPTLFGSYFRNIVVNKQEFKLNICDSSGEQDFLRLQSMSYLDADLLVLCIDITQNNGLKRAEPYAQKTQRSNVPVVLCVNKIDLCANLKESEIKKFAQKYQMNGYVQCTSNDHALVIETMKNMVVYADSETLLINKNCCGLFNCCKKE